MSERRNILLGVTGSVATIKLEELVRELLKVGEVSVIATERSRYFSDATPDGVHVWTEADEWTGDRYKRDQPVPHIDLGDWADILVVAPLSANTLTKMALGLADNLLTCTYYAWHRNRNVVVAPAMNTRMWNSRLTVEHLEALRRRHGPHCVVDPVEKRLACGTVGLGAMAAPADIAARTHMLLQPRFY